MTAPLPRLAELADALAERQMTSVELVEACLVRIAASAKKGDSSIVHVDRDAALAAAESVDHSRRAGQPLSRLAGIPISIKDNIDVRGERTWSGSRVSPLRSPAQRDAVVLERLKIARAIPIARTTMVEFAYSGLGLNDRLGTPVNPCAPDRVPGGSSSGAATALRRGLCSASIGTDTAGSVRIPAAFCGLSAFKATQISVPGQGIFPLAPSYDSVGSIGASIECCGILHTAMAAEAPAFPVDIALETLRLGVLDQIPQSPMDEVVRPAFERALGLLSACGVSCMPIPWPFEADLREIERHGGIVDHEAAFVHADMIASHAADYDRRVRIRIASGRKVTSAQHQKALDHRSNVIRLFADRLGDFDAVVLPTVAIVPPRLEDLHDDDSYFEINRTVLRNARIANIADGCAATLPCHAPGELPVGLMLVGAHGTDRNILAIADKVSAILASVASRPTLCQA